MVSARNLRHRQQTLTQLDFVQCLTPEDDSDLELLDHERYSRKRRKISGRDENAPVQRHKRTRKTTNLGEDEENVVRNIGDHDKDKKRGGVSDGEGVETTKGCKRKAIDLDRDEERTLTNAHDHPGTPPASTASNSAKQDNAPTRPARTLRGKTGPANGPVDTLRPVHGNRSTRKPGSPLKETSINRRNIDSLQRSRKETTKRQSSSNSSKSLLKVQSRDFTPKMLAGHSRFREHTPGRRKNQKTYRDLGRGGSDESTGKSTPSMQLVAPKTEIQDSEEELSDSGEEGSCQYTFGTETQAIVDEMSLTPEELQLQAQFLAPDKSNTPRPTRRRQREVRQPNLTTQHLSTLSSPSIHYQRVPPQLPPEKPHSLPPESSERGSQIPLDISQSSQDDSLHLNLPSPVCKVESPSSQPSLPSRTPTGLAENRFSQATTVDLTQSSPKLSSNITSSSSAPQVPTSSTQDVTSSGGDDFCENSLRDWLRPGEMTMSQLLPDSLMESVLPPPPPLTQESGDES
ncbi:MAG: hypothetical protein M1837_001608 [Sclerophora amabilis]|nr:MAG: hypothetical protein M1837_001608 [Sclerophora amabilis]